MPRCSSSSPAKDAQDLLPPHPCCSSPHLQPPPPTVVAPQAAPPAMGLLPPPPHTHTLLPPPPPRLPHPQWVQPRHGGCDQSHCPRGSRGEGGRGRYRRSLLVACTRVWIIFQVS